MSFSTHREVTGGHWPTKTKDAMVGFMEFVYFSRPQDQDGPIRIAEADNPRDALEEASKHLPWPLYHIGAVDGYEYPAIWFHQQLHRWHIREDWYEATPEVLCLIEDAIQGNVAPIIPGCELDCDEETRNSLAEKDGFPIRNPYPDIEPQPTAEPKKTRSLAHAALAKIKAAKIAS